jgi:hypothetical protein
MHDELTGAALTGSTLLSVVSAAESVRLVGYHTFNVTCKHVAQHPDRHVSTLGFAILTRTEIGTGHLGCNFGGYPHMLNFKHTHCCAAAHLQQGYYHNPAAYLR